MRLFSILLLVLAPVLVCAAGEVPSTPLASKGDVILSDDFERTDLGRWKPLIGTFAVEGGALKGVQTRADHGAVGRFYHPMKDVVVEFKFQLDGSSGFNAVFDDQKFKGSHAGHICRASFTPKQLRLADDKKGIMSNELYEMRKDPARKAEADKLAAPHSSGAKINLEQKRWYQVAIEVMGDEMRVSLDGTPIAYLKSEGVAHETKSSFHFTVNGKGVLFDDVKIWQAVK
ncbi:MAG: hypothetical protein ACO1TE_04110 [Prosthecobacter sp.]